MNNISEENTTITLLLWKTASFSHFG